MILRNYQDQAASATFEQWKENTSTLVVIPTGGGKTVVFAEIIRRMQPARALVIAHREELIWQAKDKIERFAGLDCEIEMADMVAATSLFHRTPVVIATIQTLISGNGKKRMDRFNPMDFGLVVIDEAHHITASSYRKVLDYFTSNPALKVLGVTATPDRADEEALGQLLESVAYDYEILDAIHDGWLVPVDQQLVTIDGLDFSAIRTTAGDLNGADLAAVMESEKNLQGMCGAAITIIEHRQTIVFTASVKHAEMACDIFNRYKENSAAWVCGATSKEERRKTMAEFSAGKRQILCNVGVATEGFDVPGVEVIVMGRPTKSRSLYSQMAGRAMRPLPGLVDGLESADERKSAIFTSPKPTCLLVDFVGNSGRHKLMSSADILGGRVSEEVIELALRQAKKKGRVLMADELAAAEEELRLRQERRREEEARRMRLVAKVAYKSRAINPFDAFDMTPNKERGWDLGRTLSEKQRALLLKQGVDPDAMPYVQAKQLLDEQFRRWSKGLCTLKQAAVLKKHGVETHELTMAHAKTLIDRLAANHWQHL